jgi:hypothetical protein
MKCDISTHTFARMQSNNPSIIGNWNLLIIHSPECSVIYRCHDTENCIYFAGFFVCVSNRRVNTMTGAVIQHITDTNQWYVELFQLVFIALCGLIVTVRFIYTFVMHPSILFMASAVTKVIRIVLHIVMKLLRVTRVNLLDVFWIKRSKLLSNQLK